jgi:hypothetical protein
MFLKPIAFDQMGSENCVRNDSLRLRQGEYRGALPGHLSQRNGFGEHALANIPPEHALGRDVNMHV